MTKQIINNNLPGGLINTGHTANDKSGDKLRDAFNKINDAVTRIDANFAELYGTDTSTKYHLGDDVQFVDVDPASGVITIQSGYNTGMPVYIKGANCANGGVGGNVVIEAGGPPLGELITGTVGNVEIAAQQTTIDSNGNVWTFRDDGTLETPNGQTIFTSPNGLGIQSNDTAGIVVDSLAWQFRGDSTLDVPSLFPRTFTAVLDTAHMLYPNPAVALGDVPWSMDVTFAIVDGQLETQIQQIFPIQGNPGYVSGYTFGFAYADHGIPGYGFTIELQDVVLPGGAGWTANLAVSPAPDLPATIRSEETIKLTANTSSWILGSDGNLILPDGGIIKNFNGTEYGGVGGTVWTNDANGCLRAELSSTGFQAFTSSTHVDLQDGGIFNIGSYLHRTTISNDGYANPNDLLMQASDAVFIVSDLNTLPEYQSQWMFSGKNIQLPAGGDIVDSNNNSVLGSGGFNGGDINFTYGGSIFEGGHDLPGRSWRTGLNIVGSQTTSTDPVRIYPAGMDGKGFGMGTVNVLSDRVEIQGNNQGTAPGITWTFAHDGSLTFPNGAGFGLGDNGQLKVNDSTTLKLDIRDNSGRGFYTNEYGVTIRSDGDHNFSFGTDGYMVTQSLYLQGYLKGVDGSTGSTGQVLTRQSNGGVAWANTTSANPFDQTLNTTNSVTFKTLTVTPAMPGNVAVFNGPSGADNLAIYNNGAGGSGTAIQSLSQIGGEYAPLVFDGAGINIRSHNSGGYKEWIFGNTGKLQLPAGGDIVDSTGETVLGFAASYLSGYNVVSSDPGGIKVTGDVTSTFSSGQIIKFSTLTEDEYTVDTVTYDNGNDWTVITLVEELLGPVNGDAIYFEKYNVSEIYPGDGIYATLMNNVLTLGTTGAYYPSTPADWNGDAPTTITEAIDRLAALVKSLNSGTGA